MSMKRKHKLLLLGIAPVSIILLFLAVWLFRQAPVPAAKIEESRETISRAAKNGAETWAPNEYKKAVKYREEMLTEWRKQNNTPVYKRTFDRVEELAGQSVLSAQEAIRVSERNRRNLELRLEEYMKTASTGLNNFEHKYYRLPLPESIRQNYIRAKMLFAEGQSASGRNDTPAAAKSIQASMEIIENANEKAGRFVQDYFNMFPTWKKWVQETIQWSAKSKDYAIVVDKLAHTCTVYRSGNAYKTFSIEMGINWIGDKVQQGDKTTPEGKYYITKKLEKQQTKYYKALLINYPNDEDRKRFSEDIKNGNLPPKTHIGNLIEIHGEGGKGIHWTDGCVALENKDMDILYQYAKVGTPVTIVGSTIPLSQIFD